LDSLLALFPLEVVLFPGTPLPLHIFEPRYKEMIGECLEQKRQFGVRPTWPMWAAPPKSWL
jgi:Lon protease-like protein